MKDNNPSNIFSVIATPFGNLGITVTSDKLKQIHFLPEAPLTPKLDKHTQVVADALQAYFNNSKNSFDLITLVQGTDFQKKVWNALTKIPCGTTLSYQALAQKLKTGPRAVGNACRRNPIPVVVPCHRVVAKKNLGGFAGQTDGALMQIKQWLLTHEGVKSTLDPTS